MTSMLILLLLFSTLLLLLAAQSTHMAWYYKLRRWIWHRRLIKKIEKELNARTLSGVMVVETPETVSRER